MATVTTKFVTLHKGDIIEGTITKLTPGEILVDIGAKTEAVVLEKEKKLLRNLLESLHVGDKVNVSVLNPESDFGNPVVSLRRFTDEKMWDRLAKLQKSQEVLEVTVDEVTKGGFLVSTKTGTSGFLPNSHTSFLESSQNLVGKTLKVVMLEVNRPLRKILFSQKGSTSVDDFMKATKTLKVGEKIQATISNVTNFGLFLSLPLPDGKFIEGFLHISEASWEKTADLSDKFTIGDVITVEITGFDKESRRVNASLKRMTTDPMLERLQHFTKDQKVSAVVGKSNSRGVSFMVATPDGATVEAFMKKESIPPTVTYSEGQTLDVTISDIDQRNHRLTVSPVLKEKPLTYR